MDDQTRTLEQIDNDIAQNHRDFEDKHDSLIQERNQVKVAGMEPEVVEQARNLGINPDNFETTEHLQEAIKLQEEQRSEAENGDQTT